MLNHTSLFEPIFAQAAPSSFLWQIADHGVVPIAQKTIERPFVGALFRRVAAHVVPITRKRDHTWSQVLGKIDDPKALVVILPEGRMMRRDGLDSEGRPMTVRGGISDILRSIDQGRMLLAYSGGLHHVQAPGERFPRLFQRVGLLLEVVDIADYRAQLDLEGAPEAFRDRVVANLTARRDRYCRPVSGDPSERG